MKNQINEIIDQPVPALFQSTPYIAFDILERIVLLYLELQFPLSALSLRFAARIPPQMKFTELQLK